MEIKQCLDLDFVIVAEPHSHHVDYKIYNMYGYDQATGPYFCKEDENGAINPVDNIEEADVFMSGSVKWDGCSNWHFNEQERGMIHGCCKDHLVNIGLALGEAWDWTKELIPNTWHVQ